MNKIKVAKELIKLAKQLAAENNFEQRSDLDYFVAIHMTIQEFLSALDKYLKLRAYFSRAFNAANRDEFIKIKGKLAVFLQETNSNFQNLSTNALLDKIDETIMGAKDSLNKVNKDLREIGFQRYIGALIETKKTFFSAAKVGKKKQIYIRDNAEYLLSKIADIIHNQNKLILDADNQKIMDEELIALQEFLKTKNIELKMELSKQSGNKNYSDNMLTHVNKQEYRVRIKEEAENLIKFVNVLNTKSNQDLSEENIDNQRFRLVRRMGNSIVAGGEAMLGYFTTINTLTLSSMKNNRKKLNLIDINKDITKEKSQQFSEIKKIVTINLEKFQELMNKTNEKGKITPTVNWRDIKKDLSVLFDDKEEYKSLTPEEKDSLIEKLKEIKTNFNNLRKQQSVQVKVSSVQNINAGFVDNVLDFVKSTYNKIKNTISDFINKFSHIEKSIENDKAELENIMEQDKQLFNEQQQLIAQMEEMDRSLIDLFNEIKTEL